MTPLRLLVIEDSESDTALEVRHLEKTGYTVAWQRVEDEAGLKEALGAQDWDIILADYQLPDFDAPRALAILQETGLDIPFIVVSGAIGEETAVDLMRSGACDYLIKGKLARLGPAVERELVEAEVRRERTRAYQALRESEANLQRSQQIARIGHWVFKPQTGEVSWSGELYRIFGLDPAETKGVLDQAWLRQLHPDDAERMAAAQQELIDTYQSGQEEYRIVLPDGTIRYVMALASGPVRNAQGSAVQISGVVQDITERKLVELALVEKMEESQKRARELEAITVVSRAMRSAQTRTELVETVLENLIGLLGAQFATLAFLEGNRLIFDRAAGSERPWHQREAFTDSAVFSEVLHTGKAVTLECPAAELPEWICDYLPPRGTLMIHPLLSAKNITGILLVGFDRMGGVLPEQANLVAAVASMAGNAINRMLATQELERMVERREEELEHIYQVASAASESLEHHEGLQQALALTLHAVKAETGGIYLFNQPDGTPDWVAAQDAGPDQPDRLEQAFPMDVIEAVVRSKQTTLAPAPVQHSSGATPAGTDAVDLLVAVPMRSQDRVVGVLVVRKPMGDQEIAEKLTLLSFIADHLALVVENTRLHQVAEQSAVLEERSRLARELHDSVMQLLYSANLYAVGAQRFGAQGKMEKVDAYLDQIGMLTQQALKDMRLLVYQLRTVELVQNGLVGALQNRLDAVERRSGIQVMFEGGAVEALPERVEENLYRIALEALNNSIKHAQATRLWIELKQQDDQVELVIRDDGSGFDPARPAGQGGMGLGTMRERAERLGGKLSIEAVPGGGTKIHVMAPLAGRRDVVQGGNG